MKLEFQKQPVVLDRVISPYNFFALPLYLDNEEGQIKSESHYHIIKKLNSDVKENSDEPKVKRTKIEYIQPESKTENYKDQDHHIQKNTYNTEEKSKNITFTDKLIPEKCNRCTRVVAFECKNQECAQLLR